MIPIRGQFRNFEKSEHSENPFFFTDCFIIRFNNHTKYYTSSRFIFTYVAFISIYMTIFFCQIAEVVFLLHGVLPLKPNIQDHTDPKRANELALFRARHLNFIFTNELNVNCPQFQLIKQLSVYISAFTNLRV